MEDVHGALFDVLDDLPVLAGRAGVVLSVPESSPTVDGEERLYQFLLHARRTYGGLPDTVLSAYESSLDRDRWVGVVAWRLFSTETNDLDDAITVVCMATRFLTDLGDGSRRAVRSRPADGRNRGRTRRSLLRPAAVLTTAERSAWTLGCELRLLPVGHLPGTHTVSPLPTVRGPRDPRAVGRPVASADPSQDRAGARPAPLALCRCRGAGHLAPVRPQSLNPSYRAGRTGVRWASVRGWRRGRVPRGSLATAARAWVAWRR